MKDFLHLLIRKLTVVFLFSLAVIFIILLTGIPANTISKNAYAILSYNPCVCGTDSNGNPIYGNVYYVCDGNMCTDPTYNITLAPYEQTIWCDYCFTPACNSCTVFEISGLTSCGTTDQCAYVTPTPGGASPTPTVSPTPATCGAQCIYLEPGIGCFWGNCTDGSTNCSYNVNCSYVFRCSSGASVACPGSSPTPTLSPTPPPTATATLPPGVTVTPKPTATPATSPTPIITNTFPTPSVKCSKAGSTCSSLIPNMCQDGTTDCASFFCHPYLVQLSPLGYCDGPGYITPTLPAPNSAPTFSPNSNPCNNGASPCQTALGSVDTSDLQGFVRTVFAYILGLAGAIGFLLLIYAGYLFMTSAGDKQKIQAAREIITSVILGLLFIVFSVAVIQFLGIQVIQIPNFGG